MKILNLTANSKTYTCHVYLILGNWNALDDVNTLIDAGRDPNLIHIIRNISTGVGKKPIDQIILTHSHYDHTGMITEIKKEFNPLLCAYLTYQKAEKCKRDDIKLSQKRQKGTSITQSMMVFHHKVQ